MCLKIDKSKTASMLRRKHNLIITCYKVVNKDWTNLYPGYANYKYTIGWNHSNVDIGNLQYNPINRYVNRGIHVFKNLNDAKIFSRLRHYPPTIILECKCHVRDLLGIGIENDMAFTRVYITGEVKDD